MRVGSSAKALFFNFFLLGIASVGIAQEDPNSASKFASLSLDELLEIEISSPGKIPEAIRDTPASIYLIERRDIEHMGFGTLTEALENVPGYYNIDNYNGVSGNFGARGFWNGRSQNSSVAILVNGIPQMRMDEISNPMETINVPVEAIDRIEVINGPNSVIYGNGASFGAINIITNEFYFQDQVGVSYGSGDTKRSSLRWSEHNEDGHIILNAGYLSEDGPDYNLSDLMSPAQLATLPFFGIPDGDASLDKRLERISRFFQVNAEWKDWYLDYTLNDTSVEHFPGAPPIGEGSIRHSESSRIALGWKRSFENQLAWDTKVIHTDYNIDQNFDGFYEGFVGYHWLTYDSWETESLLTYVPSDRFQWVAGVNWQVMKNLDELTHVPLLGLTHEAVQIDKRETRSAFTQSSVQLSDKIRVAAGFRYEERQPQLRRGYHDITKDTEPTFGGIEGAVNYFTPRASLIYQPSDAHVWKLLAGDAQKMPSTLKDVYDPERTRTLELNYNYSAANTLFSVSLFNNSLKNLLIEELKIEDAGNLDTDTFSNGSIETNGIELLLKNNLKDDWSAELGVTIQDSEDRLHPEREVAYSPESTLHAKLIYDRNHFSAALIGRYVDEIESHYSVSTANPNGGYGVRISDTIDSYTVFDANFRWDDIWDRVYISVQVKNLFDSEIRYPNNPVNSTMLDRGLLGRERSLQISSGYAF